MGLEQLEQRGADPAFAGSVTPRCCRPGTRRPPGGVLRWLSVCQHRGKGLVRLSGSAGVSFGKSRFPRKSPLL